MRPTRRTLPYPRPRMRFVVDGEQSHPSVSCCGTTTRAMTPRGAASIETLLAQLSWLKTEMAEEIRSLAATREKYESGKAELQNALTQARIECAKAAEQRLSMDVTNTDQIVFFTPQLVTLLVLSFASQRLRPPAYDGRPYRRGQQL